MGLTVQCGNTGIASYSRLGIPREAFAYPRALEGRYRKLLTSFFKSKTACTRWNSVEMQTVRGVYAESASYLSLQVAGLSLPRWTCPDSAPCEERWRRQLDALLQQAYSLNNKVRGHRLQVAACLATTDAETACRIVASEIRESYLRELNRIKRRVHTLSGMMSASSHIQVANEDSSGVLRTQRRWFLRHGAHPTENHLTARPAFTRLPGGVRLASA